MNLLTSIASADGAIAGAATGFRLLDWVVVALFLLWMLWIGYQSGRRNRTAEDYVLGGRTMNPVMVGISLFATLLSTLSYLSYPGEMIKYGPVVFIGLAAFPIAYFLVSRLMIPRYMKMKVTSAYEILEIRLGRGVRTLATIFFLSLRFLWMATIIYATVDVALIPVFGLDPGWVPIISVVLAVITVIYTTMGGLKAVVLTDVIQTVVMFAGVLLTIGIIGGKVGSVGAFFEPQLFEHWPPIEWGVDPSKRMTVGNILLMTLVWQVCTAGSDQMAIQRYLSTPDVATAKRSYRISLVTSCTIQLLLAVVGLVVMTYFLRYPQMLAPGTTVAGDADTLFPRFILIGLPAGITGLIAAGIMSAAMSSLSSGLNSSATVIYEDIINRNRKESNTSLKSLRHIKLIAVTLGVVVALSSFLVAYVSGNLLDVVIKVVNLVVAPLFVLFFMALFVPWATSRGTVAGGLFSMLVAVLIAFAEIFGITALWIMPVALVSGVVASMLFSWFDRWLIRRGFLEEKRDRQNK